MPFYPRELNVTSLEQTIGNTPLVKLKRLTGKDDGEVWLKLEGNNPAGSVKDRSAYSMILRAEQRGEIRRDTTLIEATSGNTGIALAMICAARGYRLKLLMPDNMSRERQLAMQAYGAELVLVNQQLGMEGARDLAAQLEKQGVGKRLDQFNNPDNSLAHYQTTGPEIWRQMAGKLTHFVSSMGTTGTISGVGRYLKQQDPLIQVVGLQPAEGSHIPGIRNWSVAYQPTIFEPQWIDELLIVEQTIAETTMRRLALTEGIFAGVSSGGAVATALDLAKGRPNARVVAIVCDRGDRYLSTGIYD